MSTVILALPVVQTRTGALFRFAAYFQGISGDAVAIASSVTTVYIALLYKGRFILTSPTTRIRGQTAKVGIRATRFLSSPKLTIKVVVQRGGCWGMSIRRVLGRQKTYIYCSLFEYCFCFPDFGVWYLVFRFVLASCTSLCTTPRQ